MCMLIIVSCTPCCLIACINFHIMHPDFTQIAISENPNLNFPVGACP